MSDKYILKGTTPVVCDDLIEWAEWFEKSNRRVSLNVVERHGDGDAVKISTVFLGIDRNFLGKGPPLLFETMVFGGDDDGWSERWETWEQAEEGHAEIVAAVAAGRSLTEGEA